MQLEDTNHPEEHLSAAFDGEVDSAVDVPADRRAKLEQDWTDIRSGIQALPSKPVDLVSTVQAEISGLKPASVVTRPAGAMRRNSILVMLPGIVGVAAALLLGVLPIFQNSDIAPQLVPSVKAAEWNVVVVNIADDATMEDSVRAVLGAARQHGGGSPTLLSENDNSAEYSAGILLADGGNSQTIKESLGENQLLLEWNPVEIDGRSHEEIKQIFLSSMQIPSQSEKVFGAMYVVGEDSLTVSAKPLESGAEMSSESTQVASTESLKEREHPSSVSQPARVTRAVVEAVPDTNTKAPLFVIFRRKGQAPRPPASPDQGRLQPKVRLRPAV